MYKLLYPSIRARTAPPVRAVRVRTRVSVSFSFYGSACVPRTFAIADLNRHVDVILTMFALQPFNLLWTLCLIQINVCMYVLHCSIWLERTNGTHYIFKCTYVGLFLLKPIYVILP